MRRNIKKVVLFIALTFVASWFMAGMFFGLGGRWGSPASLAVAVGYMFVPAIMAIIVQKLIYKEPMRGPLGISFKLNCWFVVAWFLPLIISLTTIGVSLMFPGVEFTSNPEASRALAHLRIVLPMERLQQLKSQMPSLPFHPFWFTLLQGLIAGITINAVAGFGEELGWRGFLQKELGYLGFWKSSAFIGVIWGVWHAPVILQGHNYPQHRVIGVFMMVILCVLFAPIFSYVRLKAKSVIAAAIIHGSFNATAGLPLMVIKGGSNLTIGITGLAGFITLGLVNIGLLFYERVFAKEPIIKGGKQMIKRRIVGIAGVGLWLVLIAIVVGLQVKADGAEQMFEKLPEGWQVEKSFTASKEQTAAISDKLGGKIDKLTNTIVSFKGQRLQVNVMHCPTKNDAEKIYKAVLEGHNDIADYALMDGNLVVEFAKCRDIELARGARRALGLELARLDSIARKLIRRIPSEWQVVDSFIAPQEQTDAIAKKLGGRIKNLSNAIFSVKEKRFQVNVIECETGEEAEKIHNSILKIKQDPAFCLKFDNLVVEFVGDDVELAKKAVYELGIKSPPIEILAKNVVSLLVSGDYAKVVENFDETMKKELPADKLKAVWDSLTGQVGAFVEQTTVRKEKILQYDVVFVTCKFEKAVLDTKVVFDDKRRIAGLFFIPPQRPTEK